MSDQMEFIFPEEFDKIGWSDEYYLLYLWLKIDEEKTTDNRSDQGET